MRFTEVSTASGITFPERFGMKILLAVDLNKKITYIKHQGSVYNSSSLKKNAAGY